MPALSKFLDKSAKESYKKPTNSVYKFTQIYKLQRGLMSTLSQVVKDLKLREKDLWDVLSTAEPYLSSNQHPLLQVKYLSVLNNVLTYKRLIV